MKQVARFHPLLTVHDRTLGGLLGRPRGTWGGSGVRVEPTIYIMDMIGGFGTLRGPQSLATPLALVLQIAGCFSHFTPAFHVGTGVADRRAPSQNGHYPASFARDFTDGSCGRSRASPASFGGDDDGSFRTAYYKSCQTEAGRSMDRWRVGTDRSKRAPRRGCCRR